MNQPAILAAGHLKIRLLPLTVIAAVLLMSQGPAAYAECQDKPGIAGSFELNLESGGITRSYLLDVPPNYDPAVETPLVFNFHGLYMSASGQRAYADLVEPAFDRGMIVVHPDGYGRSWNAGGCCGQAAREDIDDIQFVRDMLSALQAEYCIDVDRIHTTGFSNGGHFSHRLACEMADVFASSAPVSGYVYVDCEPVRPMPVHHTHGTRDLIVPYGPAEKDLQEWAQRNRCEQTPTPYYEEGRVTCIRYGGCDEGADVELCSLGGTGHSWVNEEDYHTSESSLDFFEAHPMVP